MKTVLVSGATGFIGSHTCVELIEAGFDVVAFDNLCNSKREAINRVEQITGTRPRFYEADMLDRAALEKIFDSEHIDAVIHFAGLKAVGESVVRPWDYYRNNIDGTLELLDCMLAHDCTDIVFSSSATVYAGNPIPYNETMPKGAPASPYGWTKWMIEQILEDMVCANKALNVVSLRYFNPIGAHQSGLIGEDPKGIPNNLMPYVAQVAVGKRDMVHVFGNDYNTPDGTCRRDYIHVVDLSRGHVRALEWMEGKTGFEVFNLGGGRGTSVLEIIEAFSAACGHDIAYCIDPRRDGDLPEFWADATKARDLMGWSCEFGIEEMCRDSWNWQQANPDGFTD